MGNRSKVATWSLTVLALSWVDVGCTSEVCADDQSACAATTTSPGAPIGRWTGYVEQFAFPSGSDALDLTLHIAADGSLAGELVMGEGAAPPPVTDGTTAWPPGTKLSLLGGDVPPLEGFAYHLANVQATPFHLTFDLNLSEPWAPWCRLQTSYDTNRIAIEPDLPPYWACTPHRGVIRNGDQCLQSFSADPDVDLVVVDCGWFETCYYDHPCACTADGCDAAAGPGIAFDISFRGDEAAGSETTSSPPDERNVRLTRASR